MASPNGADRAKAMRIRLKLKNGQTLKPEEAAWFSDYERARDGAKVPRDVGASASATRKVSYSEEETQAAAIGTGAAAEIAAAAALAREEGRRIDSLTDRAITALEKACAMHEKMAEALLARFVEESHVHTTLLESLRTHFIARTEAEVDLMRAQAAGELGGLDNDEMIKGMLMQYLQGRGAAKAGNPQSPKPGAVK